MNAEQNFPRATIVTALHEYRACEELWMQAVANQSLPSDQFEVIVIDAVGHPNYADLLSELKLSGGNIIYKQIPRHGRARALNHALSLASSPIVIFVADDFVIDQSFVETHIQFHETHPEATTVAIGAAFITEELRTEFTDWLEETGRFFGIPFRKNMRHIPEDYFYVGNASVKRELLKRTGAFDEIFLYHAGDDFDFGQRLSRAGMKAEFLAEAHASHFHSVTLQDRAWAYRQLGENARAVAEREGEATWIRSLKLSAPLWSTRVGAARAAMRLKNNTASRQRWWRMTLDAAFAQGYRRGQNGNGHGHLRVAESATPAD